MYNQNNETMMNQMPTSNFLLPDMVEGDFTSEELSEDMEGIQLSFRRAKIPGGGVTQLMVANAAQKPGGVDL